ncbi:hypothetical protein Pyn_19930 [Prunus yedoensis var. nudiflora]|uniref:Uncharacterized protein n=1 Tax=Prunus yedoensis var. nudiflora TaxID=2094558 RepID=A0A314Z376_PRUYE|nr:hypothetical protein Pyn_19930 [Prunus yedoensis var. nudiflora]
MASLKVEKPVGTNPLQGRPRKNLLPKLVAPRPKLRPPNQPLRRLSQSLGSLRRRQRKQACSQELDENQRCKVWSK